MMDARHLVATAQAMVDAVIPISDSSDFPGDFSIVLTVKRISGASLADADIAVSRLPSQTQEEFPQ